MASLTNEQIEQKKQLLSEKLKEEKALQDELMEAGAYPLDDDELDGVAGGGVETGGRVRPDTYADSYFIRASDSFGF